MFLSANVHAHSYIQGFPKGLHKGITLKKKIETNEGRGRVGVIAIQKGFTFVPEQSSTPRKNTRTEKEIPKVTILQS